MDDSMAVKRKKQLFQSNTKKSSDKSKFSVKMIHQMQQIKTKFFNLSIGKRLAYGFAYMAIIAVLFFAVGLTGMLSLENKIKLFRDDAYKMETSALGAEVALMNMQNYIYKAMQTDKEAVSITLAEKAEEEYIDMLSHLEDIYSSNNSVKSVTPEMKVELQNELKKAERYHKKFTECITNKDIEGAFDIYKNDYAPILNTVSTVLNSIYTAAGQYAGMYVANSGTQTIISIIAFLILVVVGMISSFFMAKLTSRSIVEPIKEIEEAVAELSKGNLEFTLNYHSKEELGSLSHALRKTTVILKDYIENITEVLRGLENKDMKVQVTADYIGSFAPIKESLKVIIKFYHEMTDVLKSTSTEVSSGAQQLSELSQAITKDANAQTESIQALVDQVNIIWKEIDINAEHVSQAQILSNNSMETALTGNQQMQMLTKAVEDISHHSKEIASINKLIRDIAEQTHLLSLNASIEAARAGSQGLGFAVVAEEIRKLSDQTREASHTVNALIDTSLHSIQQGNILAKETAGKLKSVEEYSAKTNQLITSVSEGSQHQTEKLKAALNFLKDISNISNENLAVAEESYATSTEFLNQADILRDKLSEFVI